MARYTTEQRRELTVFLQNHPHQQFSARQILQALGGEAVSLSAVYRNLEALSADGLCSRSLQPGSREIFYQYLAAEGCKNAVHLHCTLCGGVFHLSAGAAASLAAALAADRFVLDRSKTVLCGICPACQAGTSV